MALKIFCKVHFWSMHGVFSRSNISLCLFNLGYTVYLITVLPCNCATGTLTTRHSAIFFPRVRSGVIYNGMFVPWLHYLHFFVRLDESPNRPPCLQDTVTRPGGFYLELDCRQLTTSWLVPSHWFLVMFRMFYHTDEYSGSHRQRQQKIQTSQMFQLPSV